MATVDGARKVAKAYATAPRGGLVWRNALLTLALVLVAAGVATSLVGVERQLEVARGLDVDVPRLCATAGGAGDRCGDAMNSALGKPFGIPAAALGFATHTIAFLLLIFVAGGATTAAWALVRGALAGLAAVRGVLIGALLLFFVIGRLALGYSCEICFAMHTVNLLTVVGLWMAGRAYDRRLQSEAGMWPGWLAPLFVVATLAAIPALARSSGQSLAGGFGAVSDAVRASREVDRAKRLDLLRPCLGQCVEGLVWGGKDVPKAPTIDFGPVDGGGAYRVVAVDLTCPHCRSELRNHGVAAMELAVQGRGPPVRVVLRPRASQCNADSDVTRLGERMCRANAAFACAARSGPQAAIAYLRREFELAHEEMHFERSEWLATHVGAAAQACYDREDHGGFPVVKALASAGLLWQRAAEAVHQECKAGLDDGTKPDKIFWCFKGLPGLAVVRPPTAAPMRGVTADPFFEASAAKEQEFRWALSEPCL